MEKLKKFITQKINKNNKLLIMALIETTNIPLGFIAPSFELLNVTNKNEKLNDLKSTDATVIVFMCNHCPYVIHVLNQLVKISIEYKQKNVNFIGINSNDIIS